MIKYCYVFEDKNTEVIVGIMTYFDEEQARFSLGLPDSKADPYSSILLDCFSEKDPMFKEKLASYGLIKRDKNFDSMYTQ